MPWNYFDRTTMAALADLEHKARIGSCAEILADASRILEAVQIEDTWHSTAEGIYRNWLEIISERKKLQLQNSIGVETPVTAETSSTPVYAEPSTTLTASRNMLTIL